MKIQTLVPEARVHQAIMQFNVVIFIVYLLVSDKQECGAWILTPQPPPNNKTTMRKYRLSLQVQCHAANSIS